MALSFAMSCGMYCFRFPFVQLYLILLCTAFIEEDTQHVPSTSIPHQHDQKWFLLPRRQAWGSYDNKRRKNVTCINTVKGWTHDKYLIIVFTSLYHPMIQSFRNKNGFQEGGQTMMRCDPWPATPKSFQKVHSSIVFVQAVPRFQEFPGEALQNSQLNRSLTLIFPIMFLLFFRVQC